MYFSWEATFCGLSFFSWRKSSSYLGFLFSGKAPCLGSPFQGKNSPCLDSPFQERKLSLPRLAFFRRKNSPTTSTRFPQRRAFLLPKLAFFSGKNSPLPQLSFSGKKLPQPRLAFSGKKIPPLLRLVFLREECPYYLGSLSQEKTPLPCLGALFSLSLYFFGGDDLSKKNKI